MTFTRTNSREFTLPTFRVCYAIMQKKIQASPKTQCHKNSKHCNIKAFDFKLYEEIPSNI